MKLWERSPCEDGTGFWEKCCINNDKNHYVSVTKWYCIEDKFFVRYVRDGFTIIKDKIATKDLEEARAYIIQRTLNSLHNTACYYERLYQRVKGELDTNETLD